MHTSVVTHHRIFFGNVTNRNSLLDMADRLDLDSTEDPTVFDLVLDEGSSLTVEAMVRDTFPDRLLRLGESDAYDLEIPVLVGRLAELVKEYNLTPLTRMFTAEYYNPDILCDVSAMEVYDLLSVLANGYEIAGIFTQWSMFSNKNQYGAHAGGTSITTKYMSVPCTITSDRAETVIRTLEKHKPCEIGDYLVNEIIMPVFDGVKSEPVMQAMARAFMRFMAFPNYQAFKEAVTCGSVEDLKPADPGKGKEFSHITSAVVHQGVRPSKSDE